MNQQNSSYELKDELARFCLPEANRDPNRKLAWVNSVCFLFLLIGLLGARRTLIAIQAAPPLQQIIPFVIQPQAPPPPTVTDVKKVVEQQDNAPRVAVVIPQTPNINFSVPTIGSIVVPANLSEAPPLEPLTRKVEIGSVASTGEGGDRPAPPYPPIAKQSGEQGTVIILLGADAAGNVTSVDVKETSGFPVLDHATVAFIKKHWHLPGGDGNRIFQTSITYQLQF